MMFLEEVARYLDSQDLVTWGTDVFLNGVPDQPNNLVALFDPGGLPPSDSYTSGNDRPKVQVRVRNANQASAEAKIWNIYRALHQLSGVTLAGDSYIVDATALQTPTWLGRDQNNRAEYVFNVQFTRRGERPHLGG
jgi:hypothetical protein